MDAKQGQPGQSFLFKPNMTNINKTKQIEQNFLNIAGRLPENSRNCFVDLQSQTNSKKDRPKKFVFSLKADMLYFDSKSV